MLFGPAHEDADKARKQWHSLPNCSIPAEAQEFEPQHVQTDTVTFNCASWRS